jgi:hypothetical protein
MRQLLITAALLLAGCNQILGVSDVTLGDDDDDIAIDASTSAIDADPTAPDATPPDANPDQPDASASNVSTELGRVCVDNAECMPDAPLCVALSGSTEMWCTLPCGTTPSQATPPAGGDALCAAQYDGSAGTPVCGIYTQNGTQFDWYCVIGCNGQTDCPNNLTCGQGACGGTP